MSRDRHRARIIRFTQNHFRGLKGLGALEYPGLTKDDIFENVEKFYHRYYLRPKPILRIIKTMLEDKDVCVRRLREGYEFFKSMAQRRSDLETAKAA